MAKIITMPKLGLTMTEGTITKWLKQIDEPVKKGDLIFEVATDKITSQVEALEEGLLKRILVTEGKTVPVGTPVAILAAADEELPSVSGCEEGSEAEDTEKPDVPFERGEPSPLTTLGTDVKASPAARKLAREHGVDLIQITPTRPDGRIVEKDVFAYLEQQKKAAVSTTITKAETVRTTPVAERLAQELGIDLASITAPGRIGKEDVFRAWATAQEQQGEIPERREPLAGMRRIIAQRMSESKRIAPHVTINMEVDMSRAKALRSALKAQGQKVSYNDIVVFAAARALREFPVVNASIVEDEIVYHSNVNVGVAVALDNGLIVPVVKNADRKDLTTIATEAKDLAKRAREGKLGPDEVSGGTFTVTNLGMYGVDSFTPVINQPESAILGVNRIAEQLVVIDGEIAIRPLMNLSLSFDHRLVDGALAAQFLAHIKAYLEEPALML
jgi:pyruvate dehydrogenase E2 component (dihydrolipoamide acetyltransferase)